MAMHRNLSMKFDLVTLQLTGESKKLLSFNHQVVQQPEIDLFVKKFTMNYLIALLAISCSLSTVEAAPVPLTNDDDSKATFDIITEANEQVMMETDVLEGDMRMSHDEQEILKSSMDDVTGKPIRKRRGASAIDWKWPNGIVPYVIDSAMNQRGIDQIHAAIDEYRAKTCIRLIPRTTEPDYIVFKPLTGCWSYVGRQRGVQTISIGRGCESMRVVLHEVLHALGFYHEQSRPDRDDYVTILWENIKPGMERNFQIYTIRHIDSLGFAYDKRGIMHYSGKAFSNNSLPTIVSKANASDVLGKSLTLTPNDIAQLQAYYHCQQSVTSTQSAPTTTASTTPSQAVDTSTTSTTRESTTESTTNNPSTLLTTTESTTESTTNNPSTTSTTTESTTESTTNNPSTTSTTTESATESTTNNPSTTSTTTESTTESTTNNPSTTSTTTESTTESSTNNPSTTSTTTESTTESTTNNPSTTSTKTETIMETSTATITEPSISSTITASTTPTATTSACVDLDVTYCSQDVIQAYKNAFCAEYQIIREKCPKTCGLCAAPNCNGLSDDPVSGWFCPHLADLDYCGNSSWMNDNCRKTCCLN